MVVWVVKGAACLFQTTTPEYHAQKGVIPIAKRYNTPHRSHVVKTRMTEEEYADFTGRLEHYDISQAEFIRQAITRATIRPVVTISPVNDEPVSYTHLDVYKRQDGKYIREAIYGLKEPPQEETVEIIRMSEVDTQTVEWLWEPYIPFGKVTIVQGNPGEGKTTFCLLYTSRCV